MTLCWKLIWAVPLPTAVGFALIAIATRATDPRDMRFLVWLGLTMWMVALVGAYWAHTSDKQRRTEDYLADLNHRLGQVEHKLTAGVVAHLSSVRREVDELLQEVAEIASFREEYKRNRAGRHRRLRAVSDE